MVFRMMVSFSSTLIVLEFVIICQTKLVTYLNFKMFKHSNDKQEMLHLVYCQ